jgi:hypothetical protein
MAGKQKIAPGVTAAAPRDAAIEALVDCLGREAWQARVATLTADCGASYSGRATAQRHAIELTLERLRRAGDQMPRNPGECRLAALAAELAALPARLTQAGRDRLHTAMRNALQGANTLVPLFHLVRIARLQRDRGFDIEFAGLNQGAPFDLLVTRDGAQAEIICDVISAEAGRDVHRGAWCSLMDRVDPDLHAWLETHPGRYLLKMTLPRGLKGAADPSLPELHDRITRMLTERKRADFDEAAVLRLDPLMLAATQAGERGLMPNLRREFGPEAHLAVTSAGGGVFVMAARASREDEVAQAVQRRMAEIAPARLSGTRPGILAMFIEDTDRLEWGILRDQLRLEGAARQFLTQPEARDVVAVTCASRLELLAAPTADGMEDGELRFRNPSHPQAKLAALACAIASCG